MQNVVLFSCRLKVSPELGISPAGCFSLQIAKRHFWGLGCPFAMYQMLSVTHNILSLGLHECIGRSSWRCYMPRNCCGAWKDSQMSKWVYLRRSSWTYPQIRKMGPSKRYWQLALQLFHDPTHLWLYRLISFQIAVAKNLVFESQWVKWKQNWNFRTFKIRKVELLHHLRTLPIVPAMSVGDVCRQLPDSRSMMSVFLLFSKVRRSGQAVYNSSIIPHGGVHAGKNQAKPDCQK